MLKNIHPLLSPDLLHLLRSMGHGDELVIADRNFPAVSNAQRLVRLDGADAIEAARAILSVYPVDDFVSPAAFRMEVVGEPDDVTPVQCELKQALDAAEGRDVTLAGIERFAFYERAKQAFGIVATSEDRPYGCFILIKGVVRA
ncbi:MAG: RbsD/FucU family protein [Gammaproteobacteria bacterium]